MGLPVVWSTGFWPSRGSHVAEWEEEESEGLDSPFPAAVCSLAFTDVGLPAFLTSWYGLSMNGDLHQQTVIVRIK